MVIWQYTFHVLLKERVEKFSEYLIENREEGFDDSVFWEGTALGRDVFYPINALLPKGTSWCADIDLYGHQESNLLGTVLKPIYTVYALFLASLERRAGRDF